MQKLLACLALVFCFYTGSYAVELTSAVDFVSAYNWRATDVGNSAAIQPKFNLKVSNFEFEFWGSQALSAGYEYNDETIKFNEVDLVLKYNINTDFGTFTPFITDFYYPCEGREYFNFEDTKLNEKGEIISRGGHWYNISLQYKGTDAFPIQLLIDHCFHNDPDNTVYYEVAYPFAVDNNLLKIHAGFTKGKTATYDVQEDKWAVVNLGLSIERSIKITEEFTLPVGTALYLQPEKEQFFFVFKLTLK